MPDGWRKAGAIAKTVGGEIGVIDKVVGSGKEATLVLAGGEETCWIKADTLVQAQATDAGYAALAQMAKDRGLACKVPIMERTGAEAPAGWSWSSLRAR